MKKSWLVVIIILIVIILGMGGYLVYDKVLKDTDVVNKINKGEKNDVFETEFDHDLAKALVGKYLTRDPWYSSKEMTDGITDEIKVLLAISNTKSSNQSYTCEEAFPNQLEYFAGNQKTLKDENGKVIGNCVDGPNLDGTIYNYDEVNKTYKYLFGEDNDLPKIKFFLRVYTYAYSEKYNAYIKLSCNCGGDPSINDYYDVVSAVSNGDELEITIGYILFEYLNSDDGYEKYAYKGVNDNYDLSTSDHGLSDFQMKDVYDKEIDNLKKYKLIFKKHNKSDNYYFVSFNEV